MSQNSPSRSRILCLQHCQKDINIFFTVFPNSCPICGESLTESEALIPPFAIPSPFSSAAEVPVSVIVKPSRGSWLEYERSTTNLHIGISDSKGCTYDYDEDGLHHNSNLWSDCIAIPLTEKKDSDFIQKWDKTLYFSASSPYWTAKKYHPDFNNCYDFVLTMLSKAGLAASDPRYKNKEDFCESVLLPQTTHAAKYISMYRKLKETDVIWIDKNKE
ncbi:MKRN2 opposite strand protein-like [Lineus longissimus]|uniref:MKRN2 opposite strand protein-like n=1 Tax=Lineus longissimus TaxID=88925 RepID=UPI00315D2BDA